MNQSFVKKALMTGAALLALTAPALAQEVAGDDMIILYKGNAINEGLITSENFNQVAVGAWGAGTCRVVEDPSYGDGNGSLRVTTEGYYAGARLDFREPVDLSTCFQNQYSYLRFAVKFPPAQSSTAYGGMVMPGMDMGYGGTDSSAGAPMAPLIRSVRVVLYLVDGTMLVTTPQPVDISKPGIKGWAWLSLPFGAFKPAKSGDKIPSTVRVRRMIVSGNAKDTFNIGEIRTEIDEDAISGVSAGEDQVVAAYDPVILQGSAESRVTPLKYSWDFDDRDGIQDEASGPVTFHRFPKPQVYHVTLTVTDPMGIKKPASSTCTIEVND